MKCLVFAIFIMPFTSASDDWQKIKKFNMENLSRIQTLYVKYDEKSTASGRGYPAVESHAVYQFWINGRKTRSHFSYPDSSFQECYSDGLKRISFSKGGTVVTRISIFGKNPKDVDPPACDDFLSGYFFRSSVAQWDKMSTMPVTKETMKGKELLVVNYNKPPSRSSKSYYDPEYNYAIVRAILSSKSGNHEVNTTMDFSEFKEVIPGYFWPHQIDMIQVDQRAQIVTQVRVLEVRCNDETIQIDEPQLPPNVPVYDYIKRQVFQTDANGKIAGLAKNAKGEPITIEEGDIMAPVVMQGAEAVSEGEEEPRSWTDLLLFWGTPISLVFILVPGIYWLLKRKGN